MGRETKKQKIKEALLACDHAIELEPEDKTFLHNKRALETVSPSEFNIIT